MKPLILSIAISLLCISCFAPQQATTVQTKQTFTFDYSLKEANKLGSANMVLAFIKPYYASDFAAANGELFQAFQSGLEGDIEELIVGKGFSLKGPFTAYDELVFDDKKKTDMIIQIEIAPRFTAQEGGWKMTSSLLGSAYNTYSYHGTASLVGKINISGIEPMTNQKIWAKSVSIPNVENISIQTSGKYNRMLNTLELLNDPGIYNAVGKALQAQYTGIMDKITAHFSVEEFKDLKAQSKELKNKKGY